MELIENEQVFFYHKLLFFSLCIIEQYEIMLLVKIIKRGEIL